MVKLIFFGNLSVPDFSFDEFALLAAPEIIISLFLCLLMTFEIFVAHETSVK